MADVKLLKFTRHVLENFPPRLRPRKTYPSQTPFSAVGLQLLPQVLAAPIAEDKAVCKLRQLSTSTRKQLSQSWKSIGIRTSPKTSPTGSRPSSTTRPASSPQPSNSPPPSAQVTEAVRDVHFNINFCTDKEAMAWKNSVVSSCNATSIAGAIFATLGLQAMQLPDLNATHWKARACLSRHAVGMLNNALAIRLWLNRGQSDSGRYLDTELDHQPFNVIPLESSIAAIKLTSLPKRQLQVALFLFTVGILLFGILSWLEEVTDKPCDYRNLFIVSLAAAIVFPGYRLLWKLSHLNDERKRTEDFDLKSRGSYEQLYYLETLRRDLYRVQDLAAEMEREQMQIYAKSHGLTMDELVPNLKHDLPAMVDRATGPSGRLSKDLA